jgi:hypothetical protein
LQELKCIYAELAIWYLPHEKLPELEMVKLWKCHVLDYSKVLPVCLDTIMLDTFPFLPSVLL